MSISCVFVSPTDCRASPCCLVPAVLARGRESGRGLPPHGHRSADRLSWPEWRSGAGASAPEQPVHGDDNDAADHGDHDALDVDAGDVGDLEDRAGQVAPDDSTHDAQDDGEDDAFAAAHDQVRDESGDRTQDDPHKDSHGYLLLTNRRRVEYPRHQISKICLRPRVLKAAALDASTPATQCSAAGMPGSWRDPVGPRRATRAALRA